MITIDSVKVWVEDGRVVLEHDCSTGRAETTLNNVEWRIVAEEPLTVDPSVSCSLCGLHGWVTDGKFFGTPGTKEPMGKLKDVLAEREATA
jgi:hypothetical protein